jgi:hypothetical protein
MALWGGLNDSRRYYFYERGRWHPRHHHSATDGNRSGYDRVHIVAAEAKSNGTGLKVFSLKTDVDLLEAKAKEIAWVRQLNAVCWFTVTLVVQVNGKKRGEVTVARGGQNPEIEAAVLALDAVR